MSNSANVTAAKPKTGGAVSCAPSGTTLPTDASTALAAAFKSLGYITDAGVTNSISRESTDIKAWGGDTVLSTQTGKTDTLTFSLMESLDPEVQKYVHGSSNVTGTLAAGMTVKENALELDEHVLVIDTILKGGVVQRTVVPRAKVTTVGDVTYADNAAIVYPVTVTCLPDKEGNTHYEYRKGASA